MNNRNIGIFTVLIIISCTGFCALNSEKDKLIEELTGVSATQKSFIDINIKAANSNTIEGRYLSAGLTALKTKNYVLALKYFNTIILKYSKSPEVKTAYLSKAHLYKEMGLPAQASLNSKLAARITDKIVK